MAEFPSTTEKLEKRTWVYVLQPKEYGIALHECGDENPEWSEYQGHLWCAKCNVDFVPSQNGVFDGPIGVETCRMMGIIFDRFNLETQAVEKFVIQDGACVWIP